MIYFLVNKIEGETNETELAVIIDMYLKSLESLMHELVTRDSKEQQDWLIVSEALEIFALFTNSLYGMNKQLF